MYHRTFNCILSYRLPFVKNILTTIFMQDYSTTLRFCTSSDPQRDIWSCYRRKIHAITLLQNQILYWCLLSLVLLPYEFTLLQNLTKTEARVPDVLLPYEFTLLQNRPTTVDFLTRVLLPYEFTLLQNLKRGLKLLPVHVSQDIQLHLIISPPFCQKYIDYHIYASLFNYPAILHLFSPSKRHLKLLPAQNARKYTAPKHPWLRSARSQRFATIWIYTTPKPSYSYYLLYHKFYYPRIYTTPKQKICLNPLMLAFYYPRIYTTPKPSYQLSNPMLCFATLWIYTTPKPQKRTEAATSAYITRLFNYILSYHSLFCQERIILIVTTSKKELNTCVRYF